MEMHQIRYFLALAGTLNFTHAARDCGVSQPALTKAIKKLEDELGGPLIHRERDHTHLTHLGRMVMPFLEQVHDSSRAARELAENLKRGERSPLAIGVSDVVNKRHVLGPIREVRSAVSGLELRVEGGADGLLGEQLLAGTLDVALIDVCAVPDERIRFHRLYTEEMGVLLRESHPLADQKAVTLEDLLSDPWIETAPSVIHQRFHEAAREARPDWAPRHRASRPMEAQVLALSDLGLGLVGEGEPLLGGLTIRPLQEVRFSREIGVAMACGRRASVAAETLVRLFRAQDYTRLSLAA